MADVLRGLGVSAGIGAGRAYRLGPTPRLPAPVPVTDPAAEAARAAAALSEVGADLGRRAKAATDPTASAILDAASMMAADPELADAVAQRVRDGLDAAHAITEAVAVHREAFLAAGGYLAERVADLDDLRDRAVAVCLGQPMPGLPAPGHPYVLVARDLAPADTADLDPAQVLALVTEVGGPTSHTAILARAAGIPAVVGCAGALGIADGTLIAVDGAAGEVRVGVDPQEVTTALRAEHRRRAARSASGGPGRTADGYPIALLANVGAAADLTDDAEGVGLFRTELLFLSRADPPGLAEQVDVYRALFAHAAGRRVVVRTLDAGADKPLPFLSLADEPNPALGVRGLRVARRRGEVLRTQLEAIATAAGDTGADVWVMAPMVSTPGEAAAFVAQCRELELPTAGAMIEVPAAALRAAALLREVDFLSIGTNDLSQYTFAADRQCADLADLLDPWQPALLDLIAGCAEAGRAADKPVGVCGEAAADPALALVLVGLGVTSLSMSPRCLPDVRQALAAHTLEDCRRLAARVLSADDAVTARRAVASN